MRADNQAVVVDLGRDSVRVASVSREFPDLAIFPDDRLKLVHWAARVLRIVLRPPDHFTSIVDHVGGAVGASQRRELRHHAVLPYERETCRTGRGKPIRVKAAEVFFIRN